MKLIIRKSPMGMKELKWLSERAVCTSFKPNRKRCKVEREAPWDWAYKFEYPHLACLRIQHLEADGSWHAICEYSLIDIYKNHEKTFKIERPAEEYKEFFNECKEFVKKLRC